MKKTFFKTPVLWKLICFLIISFFVSYIFLILSLKGFDIFSFTLLANFSVSGFGIELLFPFIALFVAEIIKEDYFNVTNKTFYLNLVFFYTVINALFFGIIWYMLNMNFLGNFPNWNALGFLIAPFIWEFELVVFLLVCLISFGIKKLKSRKSNTM